MEDPGPIWGILGIGGTAVFAFSLWLWPQMSVGFAFFGLSVSVALIVFGASALLINCGGSGNSTCQYITQNTPLFNALATCVLLFLAFIAARARLEHSPRTLGNTGESELDHNTKEIKKVKEWWQPMTAAERFCDQRYVAKRQRLLSKRSSLLSELTEVAAQIVNAY